MDDETQTVLALRFCPKPRQKHACFPINVNRHRHFPDHYAVDVDFILHTQYSMLGLLRNFFKNPHGKTLHFITIIKSNLFSQYFLCVLVYSRALALDGSVSADFATAARFRGHLRRVLWSEILRGRPHQVSRRNYAVSVCAIDQAIILMPNWMLFQCARCARFLMIVLIWPIELDTPHLILICVVFVCGCVQIPAVPASEAGCSAGQTARVVWVGRRARRVYHSMWVNMCFMFLMNL